MKILVNGCHLYFDVYGSELNIQPDSIKEKPVMIVLHGGHGVADHSLYVEFWAQFSDIVQILFLDQRGCGRSDLSTPDTWHADQWADDLHQFCQILGINQPIVAGVSMGGHVMSAYVKHYSENARGLIFCNTEAKMDLDLICDNLESISTTETANFARQFLSNPTLNGVAEYAKICIPHYAKTAYSKAELDRCIKHPEVFLHYFKHHAFNIDYVNNLSKISCPTLLLAGADSPFHPVQLMQDMVDKIAPKFAQFEIIPDAGAPVYKDQPKLSYSLVHNFLSQLV